MQRKAEEREAAHARQRRGGLRLRRHPAAERFAAGDQRQVRQALRRLGDRGADGGMGELRRIGPLAAALHVGELVAQRRDAALGEARGGSGHERMGHAGAGAMRQHVASDARRGGACSRPEMLPPSASAIETAVGFIVGMCSAGLRAGDHRFI